MARKNGVDYDEIKSLYDAGLNDHEIAEQTIYSVSSIAYWRYRNGLPARGRHRMYWLKKQTGNKESTEAIR